MSSDKQSLFKRKNTLNPRTYSRSQRVTSAEDIQDWLVRVEDASDEAAAAALGGKHTGIRRKGTGHTAAGSLLTDVRIHDAAYAEAQDLLQQWVDDAIDVNTVDEDEEFSMQSAVRPQGQVRREWDRLTEHDYDQSNNVQVMERHSNKTTSDPYSILDADDSQLVDSVLQSLIDKDLSKEDKQWNRVLATDDSCPSQLKNPCVNMQLRHQQVRDNRLKREKKKAEKLKEQQAKKFANTVARQIVQKEEEVKLSRKRREEQQIQQEMARIRREMEEERRLKDKVKSREHEENKKAARALQAKVEVEQTHDEDRQRSARTVTDEKHRLVMQRMEELQAREVALNYKLLQSSFSTWYRAVLEKRLQLGRAKATKDWKLLLRTFNAWKSWIRRRRINLETHQHEMHLKAQQRNKTRAERHEKMVLLRRCFSAWQLFVLHTHSHQALSQTQQLTKAKMASFLQAAAQSKASGAGTDAEHPMLNSPSNMQPSMALTKHKVDRLFAEEEDAKHLTGIPSPHSDGNPFRNETQSSARVNKPLQAWQVNRNHLKLTNKQVNQPSNSSPGKDDEGCHSNRQGSCDTSSGMRPHSKKYVVNSMEHRHAAQQKILQLQQKQLREQQSLIEEMQYLQRQQLLQQQVSGQDSEKAAVAQGSQATLPKLNHQLQTEVINQDYLKNMEEGGSCIDDLTSRTDSLTIVSCITDQSQVTQRSDVTDTLSKVSGATKNSRHLKFLKSMDERAEERQKLKKDREEKRRNEEKQKLADLEAKAEEQRIQEEKEKKWRAEAFREKKRLEKLQTQERQQQLERLRQLSVEADRHHQGALLKYTGWLPWRRLMKIASDKLKLAEDHYQASLTRKVLLSWQAEVSSAVRGKEAQAHDLHTYIITQRCFNNWRKAGQYMVIQEEKAIRHYQRMIQQHILTSWANYTAEEKVRGWHNERKAKEHNIVRIQRTTFRCWRRLPEMIRDEEIREKRREEMRKKVAALIPDFGVSNKSSIEATL